MSFIATINLFHYVSSALTADLTKGISSDNFITGTTKISASQFFHV